ncbi:Indoleamine 2,3-dioxygenase 2 [Desmophyllum pertusum]|uniref:Indoleamine 2,3-dioxygenase 2 n=1 Tax=Desmophyllum pertusum TaxID=174260 RepID=A0A9W9ZIZ6_9CNID|nr:Indoleamine 2,3-dioxygenase 2 [Desmophyllum pertusum]
MASVPSPREFDVSADFGFIPEKEPLQCLPEYFSPWEEVARDLPQLVTKAESFRQMIKELPLLDHSNLSSEDEWKRAHLVLACISHSYVWCKRDTGVAKILPKCLAVPWVAVAKHLDIPPVITHCSYALYNWRYIDPSRNLKLSVMMTGSWTEEGFVKIPLQVELEFGKGFHSIIDGQESVVNDDSAGVLKALMLLKETIVKVKTSFLRIYDVCDPDEFYDNLRPYLAGWHGNPVLPDGLIYEGVSERPLQYSGGSAAQSSVFHVLDAALGVFHPKDTDSCSGGTFLERMHYYMPPKHRAFIEAVSNGPSIRNFVLTSGDPCLVEEYNHCVEKLKDFRNVHLQVVARYIMIPANRGKENNEQGMALRGTGGSGLMHFLKQIRNETASTVSCNITTDKDSSQESQKETNGIIYQ